MPATIRIQVDPITADLAAGRLREEGVPVRVVSDSDWIGVAGTPMHFSLIVPSQYEDRARRILAEMEAHKPKRR